MEHEGEVERTKWWKRGGRDEGEEEEEFYLSLQ